jgi:hypothetical protein
VITEEHLLVPRKQRDAEELWMGAEIHETFLCQVQSSDMAQPLSAPTSQKKNLSHDHYGVHVSCHEGSHERAQVQNMAGPEAGAPLEAATSHTPRAARMMA